MPQRKPWKLVYPGILVPLDLALLSMELSQSAPHHTAWQRSINLLRLAAAAAAAA
jgi:hypothetical protein